MTTFLNFAAVVLDQRAEDGIRGILPERNRSRSGHNIRRSSHRYFRVLSRPPRACLGPMARGSR